MRTLLFLVSLLTACGDKKSDAPSTAPAGSAATKPAEPPPPKKTAAQCADARAAAEVLIGGRAGFSQEAHIEASELQLEMMQHFMEGKATVEVAVRKASVAAAEAASAALTKSDAEIKACSDAFGAKAADTKAKCAAADAAFAAAIAPYEAASKVLDDVKFDAAKTTETKAKMKTTIDGFAAAKAKGTLEAAIASLDGC